MEHTSCAFFDMYSPRKSPPLQASEGQLLAEREKVKHKIVRAYERRKKDVHVDDVGTVSLVPTSGTITSIHVAHNKPREAVAKMKQRMKLAEIPRRSPRIPVSSVQGSTRKIPRILQHKKSSPLGKGKSTTSTVKQGKEPKAFAKGGAAKGKAKSKPKPKPNANAKAKDKSVRFKDDADFMLLTCDDVTGDDESDDDTSQLKLVQRKEKRKRGESRASSTSNDKDDRFNTSARVSLKEFLNCFSLLEDRHLVKVTEGGIGHIRDFKIKSNINHRLMCLLMYNINPTTMTLDLGDGQKILKITADAIEKLFALPRGKQSPPRPYDSMHDQALMDLKAKLGFSRQKQIETKDLRSLLA